ncbi:hypothetical protein LHYA1_G007083 [Lachnellula hyalina]|uniref:Heterokaryon incompatibility domain-containing protein n=1 Tax=Lachnellula hyalina TaxID=1316788 RepID=A0A8H8QYF3_9HELO|nr:uncharacterized protein LHYA1_G007083 [Lachnellula hyalina]TVY24045.1 hypothetical protein LHYA1_G007083 [Lachnellula hyalina]
MATTSNEKPPLLKWVIEDPEILPEDSPSFLCAVCRRINFKFLIFTTNPWQAVKEIPLDSFARILEKQSCAFCRLVKQTVDNNFGAGVVPVEHEGKAIMVSMISTMKVVDLSTPHELLLWLKPNPLPGRETPPLFIHTVDTGYWLNIKEKGRIVPSSQIDFMLPMFWNRKCRYHLSPVHEDHASQTDSYSLPVGFRLIDTKQMCIVSADSTFQYLTLSYTWGTGETLKLLNENFDELAQENALSKYEHLIPQTIKDAMYLVPKLMDRYLWVDALCIIQNDADDKQAQISAMDQIYGHSVLTIAVAYGEGAEAGIPGVRPGSRSVMQRAETIQDICLANRPWSFDKSVGESKWNTRAWTFQERILTKRTLFITEQQMFFKCDHVAGCQAEDLDTKLQARKPVTYPMEDTGKDTIPSRWSINIVTYQRTVESFVTRDLTYPGDMLNAFEGIAQKMRPIFRSKFLYGLPQTELEYCLLWEPWGGHLRRRRDPETGKSMFPSWSWAGWMGPVRFHQEEKLSRVKWVDESGEIFTSDEYRAPTSADTKEKMLEWRNEWVEKRTSSGFRYFHHSSDPDSWFRNPTAPEAERRPEAQCAPETGHLRFWAKTDDLKFPADWQPPKDTGNSPLWELKLADKKGYNFGYFRVPVELLPTLGMRGKSYGIVIITRSRHSHSHKEIRAVKKEPLEKPPTLYSGDGAELEKPWSEKSLEEYDDEKEITNEENFFPDELDSQDAMWDLGFDRRRYDAYKPFPLYEFLAVEYIEGIAYRIGIGKMHIDAWQPEEEEKWKKKLITLG